MKMLHLFMSVPYNTYIFSQKSLIKVMQYNIRARMTYKLKRITESFNTRENDQFGCKYMFNRHNTESLGLMRVSVVRGVSLTRLYYLYIGLLVSLYCLPCRPNHFINESKQNIDNLTGKVATRLI